MIDDQVAPDFHDPALEATGFRTETLEILINPDEYLLSQVLRLVATRGVTIRKIVNPFRVLIHNRLPGGVISPETALDHFFIAREQWSLLISYPENEAERRKVQKIRFRPYPGAEFPRSIEQLRPDKEL
jgi:hypothetical protein